MANKKVKPAEEKVHKELETVKGMLARALADYDNLSKRVDRERQDLGKMVSVGVIVKLLPVLDNLERAQKHLKDSGLAIAIGEFINVLKDEGLIEIDPNVGEEFDEKIMEAVERVPSVEEGITVKEVLMKGWKFGDGKIVRHAKVVVYQKFIVE
jgi:molecular chaperone GrpE